MNYNELRSYITSKFPEYPFFDWYEFNGTEVLDLLAPKSKLGAITAKFPDHIKWEFEEGNGDELPDTISIHL